MNMENGSYCPMPGCPDQNGTMPACAGLAVPYVPFQQKGPKKYSQSDALSNGTLFPGLNLPFHLKVQGSSLPAGPLTELQALSFVVLELGDYLDTHPDDQEAFTLFQQYSALERTARANYETQNGPLTQSSSSADERYRWLEEPWPWNFQEGEVR